MAIEIEKVIPDIEKVVEEYLNKKAEAGIEKEVEEALISARDALADLTKKASEMEAKAVEDLAEIDSLKSLNEQLKSDLEEKTQAVASLETEKEQLVERVSTAEKVLEDIEKAKKLSDRMSVLEELKVARAGDARGKQEELVCDMSDEDFEAYKEDLAALRQEFLASVDSKDVGDADKGNEGDVNVAPPDVESAAKDAFVPDVEGKETGSRLKDCGSALTEGLCELLASRRRKEEADSDK